MKHNSTLIMLGAILFCAAQGAVAQDRQTLDLLVTKGVITRAEADTIGKQSAVVTPKAKSTKSIKLVGRVQTQYENINVEEFANGTSNSMTSKNNFLMRRMFLGMEAKLGSGWSALVIADFARSSDNYLEYAYISKDVDYDYLNGKLHLGYKKTTFGVEEYMSASKLMTIERSLATRYFTEGNNGRRLGIGGRHTGVYWDGKIQQLEGLTYGASVTNSYNNSPSALPANADNNLMYSANAAYAAEFEDVSFQVGVNFSYTNGMNVAGTAATAHAEALAVNPYLKLKAYGLELWSDFLYADVSDGKNSFSERASPMGVNIAAEYKFDIGDFGKIAPAFRYSWIDTDGRGIKMSDGVRDANASTTYYAGQSLYAGLNWYINGNDLKFQLGYEWAQLNGSANNKNAAQHSDANVVRAQMQVLF